MGSPKRVNMNEKHSESAIVGIIFFFLALFVYTKFVGPLSFSVNSVNTTKTTLFQVSGDGKATAIPNTATVSFGVTKTASTVADAQNQANTTTTNIVNGIKTFSIDTKDIKTTNYSVNPNYNYNSGNQAITGYTVTQTIELKISPIEKASRAVDIATQNGANIVNNLAFILDDKTQQDIQNKARQQAIDNAKQKAQSLAQSAGMHLGKIVDIQENVNSNPISMRANAQLKIDTTASEPTQLQTGESTYTTTVTLSYETY